MTGAETMTKAKMEDLYQVEDPWSYDSTPDDQRRVSRLLSCLPHRAYQRVLDVGCGNGFLTVQLPGAEVHGVDVAENAIEWGRQRARRAERKIEFHVGNALEIDSVCPGKFDLIVITGVLYKALIGEAFHLVRLKLDHLLADGGVLAHAHIEAWFHHGFHYNLIERQIYPYREYFHLLEVYQK